jgi:hypothetical protein
MQAAGSVSGNRSHRPRPGRARPRRDALVQLAAKYFAQLRLPADADAAALRETHGERVDLQQRGNSSIQAIYSYVPAKQRAA